MVWWTIGKQYMTSANWSDTQIFIKAMELAPWRGQLTSCEPRVRFLPIPVVPTAAATDLKPRLSKETVGLVRQWCTSKLLLQVTPGLLAGSRTKACAGRGRRQSQPRERGERERGGRERGERGWGRGGARQRP